MNVFSLKDSAVNTKLTGSTVLTTALGGTAIFAIQAPDGQAKPYVVWNWQSNVQENLTPSRMWNDILNVRVFTASKAQGGSIDGIIDGLLEGSAFTITGWTNFWTAREDAFQDVITEPNGQETFVTGGLYRVRIGQ